MPSTGQKRKKPPTFQRFPAQRAKKLKETWVETAKIKSRWKAQKRREGIAMPRPEVPPPSDEEGGRNTDEAGKDDRDGKILDQSYAPNLDEPTQGADSASDDSEASEEMEDEDAAHSPPPPPGPPRRQQKIHPQPKENFNNRKRRLPHDKNNNVTSGDDQPSLRELFQKAYSKSSLHTYKSDPRERRRGYRGARNGGRGGGSADGASASRGRGQPNMKLRMSAMLEKIKRDYS